MFKSVSMRSGAITAGSVRSAIVHTPRTSVRFSSSIPDSSAISASTPETEQQYVVNESQEDAVEKKCEKQLDLLLPLKSLLTLPALPALLSLSLLTLLLPQLSSSSPSASASTSSNAAPILNSQPRKVRYFDLKSLPRVPNTEGITDNVLFSDMLLNSHMPLLSPVKKNHMLYSNNKKAAATKQKSKPKSVLQDLENFKNFKKQQREKLSQNSPYYNTYLNKENLKLPYNSIFCNTLLNTQQHNLEMFNLPLNYLEKLRPFQLINKPGEEHYRDDLIIVSKLEFEAEQKEKREKRDQKDANEIDIEEFFGFK